jgi:signal peptidase I
LEIKQGVVYTNGVREMTPKNEQRNYVLYSKSKIRKENLENFGIWNENVMDGPVVLNDNRVRYVLSLSQAMVDAIKQSKASYILSLEKLPLDQGGQSENVFPYYHNNPVKSQQVDWTLNTFGPLWIPKEGATITVNEYNLAMYGETIIRYEHNDNVVIEGSSLTIDGEKLEAYTFKQDYYFMMGDNRDNSLDSRYWGFVPADHIVGKPLFIWFSTNKDKSFPASIRWERIFKSAQE